mmetsp:Transcript_12691/g.21093  ORF Transcript_12691/g.21093 Transcript_12691/m.21093 type:complete len:463 (+) Transcript_12691:56-1444(+)|eukprot:CAMPEP_0174974130 /NCGR_PEP_ID=MMETSP0004_2-20121128/11651_1 /TAXON_ID=420556 /ORGANISM="Ochromonas sp., Strain CCMP1393" /LENGTH=462 /DNA_ID=CAMNT_0016224705 /DNA_START=35 /DNA_END=1423 /DNA_ORIENTATION=+
MSELNAATPSTLDASTAAAAPDETMLRDTWGTSGNLTEEQEAALGEFISKAMDEDLKLAKFSIETRENAALRFLRARQFSVSKALALLAECVQRKTSGRASYLGSISTDDCLQCDTEALKIWYPHSAVGYDKLNRPVLFEHTGMINPTAMQHMATMDALIDYHWHNMETWLGSLFINAPQRSASDFTISGEEREGESDSGDPTAVISTCVVLDLAGLSLTHCSSKMMDHLKALISIDNTCYPELLGKMFVINSPWLAVTTWELVKGWLDPRTQAKIEILGSGPDVTKKLLEVIPAESLPMKYGGAKPDSQCFTWLEQRPKTEFVQLAKDQMVKKVFKVPPQQVLYLDSYISEGEILLEVSTPPLQEGGGGADGAPLQQQQEEGGVLMSLKKVLMRRPESSPTKPMRVLLDFGNPLNQDMTIVAQWSNPGPSTFYSRPVTINAFFRALDDKSPPPSTSHTNYY